MKEGDRVFLRVSTSGKGVFITSKDLKFGLRANIDHVIATLKGEKEYAVFEIVEKTVQTPVKEEKQEERKSFSW